MQIPGIILLASILNWTGFIIAGVVKSSSPPSAYNSTSAPSSSGESVVKARVRRSVMFLGDYNNNRDSKKRSSLGDKQIFSPESLTSAGRKMARNFMIRTPRSGRRYDVAQIECPRSDDRLERFACPTPDFRNRYRCIDDRSLCDGFYDCPGKEDESPEQCLFYKTTKAHLDILAEALLRWARGR